MVVALSSKAKFEIFEKRRPDGRGVDGLKQLRSVASSDSTDLREVIASGVKESSSSPNDWPYI